MESLDALARQLLHRLAVGATRRTRPFLLGISGLQGSGKSTLADRIVALAQTLRAISLSLDDVYHTRRKRQQLAADVHPLLVTRGVPGTHDIALLNDTLAALSRASPANPARVPRFDKGRDERFEREQWPCITHIPDLIVLEGWCLGVPPQPATSLTAPINMLERDEDARGIWRQYVNVQLEGDYAHLWRQLDHLLVLQAPSFDVVRRWRDQQEDVLRRRAAPESMDAAALTRFLAHYERLSRHALTSLPALADTCVLLDADRNVLAVR